TGSSSRRSRWAAGESSTRSPASPSSSPPTPARSSPAAPSSSTAAGRPSSLYWYRRLHWYGCRTPVPVPVSHTRKDVYLFSYFIGEGEDGLRLATSENGLTWQEVDGGLPLLAP